MTIPQIIVTLAPNGDIVAELPGAMATRRRIVMTDGRVETTIRRILEHQQEGEIEIGLDGAPTQQQVRHWEKHSIWADSSCRFCLAEGRARSGRARQKKEFVGDGTVQIRRIAPKVSGIEKKKARKVAMMVKQKENCKGPSELGI